MSDIFLLHLETLTTSFIFFLQHKEFEEIEGRLQRREPLILGSLTAQRLCRRLPIEVISDPLDDKEIDPYEDGSDVQKNLSGHQVHLFFEILSNDTSFLFKYTLCSPCHRL